MDNPIDEEKKQVASSVNSPSSKTLSPAVRKIVEEQKINPNQIEGSGKKGMILKGDLLISMGAKPKPSANYWRPCSSSFLKTS